MLIAGLLAPAFASAAVTEADLKRMRAERRVALVIGNGKYRNFEPLDNPANDAQGVANALRGAGFQVILKLDATRDDMALALDEFDKAMTQAQVGLFYYAGHAAQVDWRNFMLPVAATLDPTAQDLAGKVAQQAMDLSEVLNRMGRMKSRINIVIMDACRDNPFTAQALAVSAAASRSTGKTPIQVSAGLAQNFAPPRTFLAYATAPGQVASDGAGRNSPYSGALIAALAVPNLRLEDVFKQVRNAVATATSQEQIPWDNSSVFDDFYFRVPATLEAAGNTEPRKKTVNSTFVAP
ncbi:MAG: caspase family protein [Pseudomonadota bacterium]